MAAIDLKSAYLELLVAGVEYDRKRFDPTTGRFLTGGGWAVTNQDIVYPLALLYTTPGNPYHRDQSVLEMAVCGADAWRSFQNADGTVEFVKVDGSTWGAIYMPWSMYYWLETYHLLRDELDDTRRREWETGLTLAYRGICRNLATDPVHNIPVWNAAAAYLAGTLFGEPDWVDAGVRMIERAVAAQTPHGYWPEHGGPTPAYNLVYLQALGLYHSFSKDESVRPALKRAAEFHIRYTYPDGRVIETIDGRVKYHDRVPTNGHVGLTRSPQGRRYAEFLVDRLTSEGPAGAGGAGTAGTADPAGTVDPGGDAGPAGDADQHRAAAHRAAAHRAVGLDRAIGSAFAHAEAGPGARILQDESEYSVCDPGVAAVRSRAGTLCCVSGSTTPSVESRWGQDRQQFLSVWRRGRGLLIGGGNSKSQLEWSTFAVRVGEEWEYLPSAALVCEEHGDPRVSTDGGEPIRATFTVGGTEFTLEAGIDSSGRLTTRWSGPSGGAIRLLLRCRAGETIAAADGRSFDLDVEKPFEAVLPPGGFTLGARGRTAELPPLHFELTTPYTVKWPVLPFNPYTKDGSADLTEAVATITVALADDPAEVVVRASSADS